MRLQMLDQVPCCCHPLRYVWCTLLFNISLCEAGNKSMWRILWLLQQLLSALFTEWCALRPEVSWTAAGSDWKVTSAHSYSNTQYWIGASLIETQLNLLDTIPENVNHIKQYYVHKTSRKRWLVLSGETLPQVQRFSVSRGLAHEWGEDEAWSTGGSVRRLKWRQSSNNFIYIILTNIIKIYIYIT